MGIPHEYHMCNVEISMAYFSDYFLWFDVIRDYGSPFQPILHTACFSMFKVFQSLQNPKALLQCILLGANQNLIHSVKHIVTPNFENSLALSGTETDLCRPSSRHSG